MKHKGRLLKADKISQWSILIKSPEICTAKVINNYLILVVLFHMKHFRYINYKLQKLSNKQLIKNQKVPRET